MQGCFSTQKSFSLHVYGRQPSCMFLYSFQSTPEGWGDSRTTSDTSQVQWIILDLRLPQGSHLRKTLVNMASVPLEHFLRSGRPEWHSCWVALTMLQASAEGWTRYPEKVDLGESLANLVLFSKIIFLWFLSVKCFYCRSSPKHLN